MDKNITLVADKKEAVEYLKNQWYKRMQQSVGKKGYYTTVLSGGSTPLDLYKEIAKLPGVPWEKVYFFMADERYVPRDDKSSNYGNIKKILFDKVPLPGENIFAFDTDIADEKNCAADYEEKVLEFFKTKYILYPVFDFILLGLGDDGHTASIFPGEQELLHTSRAALATCQKHLGTTRLSLSLELINRGINIYFMVCGTSKAQVISRLFNDNHLHLPAALVETARGEPFFVLDKEAASDLPPELLQN